MVCRARSQVAQSEVKNLDEQIESLVDRIVESQNDRETKAYESRIAKMERDKIRLKETIAKLGKSKHTFEEILELSLSFLSSPWKI